MATERVASASSPESESAITQWCDDMQWDDLSDRLPLGVVNRLKYVDRDLYALNGIQTLLFEDQLGKADKAENGVAFQGLEPINVEHLRIAALELGRVAAKCLEEIRDGKFA